MGQLELEVSPRTVLGKKVKALRRAGLIPVHLFGRGILSQSLQVDATLLRRTLARAGRNALISLKVAGQGAPQIALVREVQRNPLDEGILHIDFYVVKMTEKVRVEIPLVLEGEAPAVRSQGGIVLHGLARLEVECLPSDLLPRIRVDISALIEVNQAILVQDLRLPPGLTVLADPEQMVVKIIAPVVVAAEAEAAKAVPEEEAAPSPAAKPEAEA